MHHTDFAWLIIYRYNPCPDESAHLGVSLRDELGSKSRRRWLARGRYLNNEESTVSQMKKVFGILMVAGLMATSAIAANKDSKATEEIQSRLAPVGEVCMSGDDCAAAPAAPVAAGPRSGKEVYDSSCAACHGSGVMGAPKLGAAGDWAPRTSKGMETLVTHAIAGFNAMPAKGMCATCSDDEIKEAVVYMVDNSK